MKTQLFLLLLLGLAIWPVSHTLHSATPSEMRDQKDCPQITVSCPTDLVKAGDSVTFSANVSGGDPKVTPTYNWSVSAGTITSGQGTPSITVDTAGLGGESITASSGANCRRGFCGRGFVFHLG
jgi:hypothetical protein